MEWTKGWRDRAWNELDLEWDVIVIGGGITGAGILRQCVHAGLRAVLFEADDFASGTSSRSSKLVHGGMRYLKNGQFKVTLESVQEREYLLKQGRGLVNRFGFLYACLPGDQMPGWMFGLGLSIYDLMARQWTHRAYDALDMRELCPPLTAPGLRGGYRYFDALTDDARLVLRLVREAVAGGARALNYARVDSLMRTQAGQVGGVVVTDTCGDSDRQAEVRGRVVINATGAWADRLRGEIGQRPRLRPLRGSHLVLPFERLPLTRSISFLHQQDGRPVFALPWEGAVLFGTTDVDHDRELQADPSISTAEVEYLLAALQRVFPAQELTYADVISTYSGIRPVVNTGKANPSQESREHVIWEENGLLTVSGGKLTTFRVMARDALKAARRRLGHIPFERERPVLDPLPEGSEAWFGDSPLHAAQRLRLLARYGPGCVDLFTGPEVEYIPGTPYLWAELRRAACCEGVVHLDDLLLRRVRLGLLIPNGGLDQMEKIRGLVQSELGWEDARWEAELQSYAQLLQRAYRL
ncbi:MAG: glycerol-3-phosphate dehydrogenase/oxidase [Anaerolineales bacterium]|nr:glycerol-3-phosphate dehydrogenase/oxidase [Anaerolineales bacterium]